MLLETNEDKLSAPGVAFEDVQFGLQVRNCVFKEGTFALRSLKLSCKQGYGLSSRQSNLIDHLLCYSLTISFNL